MSLIDIAQHHPQIASFKFDKILVDADLRTGCKIGILPGGTKPTHQAAISVSKRARAASSAAATALTAIALTVAINSASWVSRRTPFHIKAMSACPASSCAMKIIDTPGRRDPHLTPYMIEPARQVNNPAYETIALVCSAQMGKTETMLDVIGATWDCRPRPMMLVGPDEFFVRNEHEPRVLNLIAQSASLRSKAATGKKTRLYQKTVAGVPLRLAWAGSESQLSGMAAWLVVFDEIDRTGTIKGCLLYTSDAADD